MVKIIHFSDAHAHLFEDFAKPDPAYVNDRFRAQIETFQKVFDLAKEHGATVLFTGDLFHKRAKIDDIVFSRVYEVFANNEVDTLMVRGNHDSRNNTTNSFHWLDTFKHLPNVTVAAVPAIAGLDCPEEDWGPFIYTVPYSDDTDFLKKKIVEFKDHLVAQREKWGAGIVGILAGHIGVDGSETGRYSHRLEGAFKVGDLFPDVFNYVCLGHYHKRQFLGGTDNVYYAGNLIQTSFSDEGQAKGVFLIDTEKGGKPEFIEIPNKQFITLTSIDENTQNIVDNNYVRFVLPQDQAQEVEIFKEESDNIRVEVQREYTTETRINISIDSDEVHIVEAYTKEFYPETTELAVDILKEAMTK